MRTLLSWKTFFFAGIACLLLAGYVVIGKNAPEQQTKTSGVPYPENYREIFIHYATIDRSDGTVRDLYINTLDSEVQPAVIVVEAYYAQRDKNGVPMTDENGHFIKGEVFDRLHVMEKRADWQPDDFVSSARVGNWNFGSFDTQTGQPFDESLTACFHCHNPTQQTDFVYSLPLLNAFRRTSSIQYFYCDLPDRLAC